MHHNPLCIKSVAATLTIAVLSTLASQANAVLPAVATDTVSQTVAQTGANTSVNMPLIPQVISSTGYNSTGNSSATSPAAYNAMASTQATTSASSSQLQSKLTASVVTLDPQGVESLSPVTPQTRPATGNIIEYHGYITNNSADRVRKMKVTFNVPTGTELLNTSSVSPQPAYGSIDGQNFMYMPMKANIGGTLQDVPMSYYKSLQWDIAGLGLNEVAEVKYRVRVK